jgi:alpha-tubulin suppressor-like RCC1 family protein
MAEVRVRSVAAGYWYSLALGWDGRVYLWGINKAGQLGHGDTLDRPSPALVEELEGVRGIAAASSFSLAVTHSGAVFSWGDLFHRGAVDVLGPILVEGFGDVRVRHVCSAFGVAFAIGEDGELSSWGGGFRARLGHGNEQEQPSPKRVEALRGVRVCSVSSGALHALALAEDGVVYAWGDNTHGALLGNPHAKYELLPKPVEALQGVRMGSIAAGQVRSYAWADTGELWFWGFDGHKTAPLGHGERRSCPVPKLLESLRGIRVDAVATGQGHTLALVEDGSVYSWGSLLAAQAGALGLGPAAAVAKKIVRTPKLIPAVRVASVL